MEKFFSDNVAENPHTPRETLYMLCNDCTEDEAIKYFEELDKQLPPEIHNSTPQKPKGNCSHIVEVSENLGNIWMYNDNDCYYEQCFNSREEVMKFIEELKSAANQVWPV